MKQHQISLALATFSSFLTGLLYVGAACADEELTLHEVTESISYIHGPGGNIGVFTGDDGVFLIDDKFAPLTDSILALLGDDARDGIRYVINTHLHGDHTGGNENFGEAGAAVIGHDNVRLRMIENNAEEMPPFITFSDTMHFHINGETVRVFKTPDAHTDGDVIIVFEGSNVIHTGDIYRTTGYPYIDQKNGGSFLGTVATYEMLQDMINDDTVIIPGHGALSDRDELNEYIGMMYEVRKRVSKAIANGDSRERVVKSGMLEDLNARFKPYSDFPSEELLLGAAYDDISSRN